MSQDVFRPQPAAAPAFGDELEPMQDFSYERDIAPLQQQYFKNVYGNRSIDPRDRERISRGIAQQFAGAYEQQAKLREMDMQSKARDLSYKSSLFALEQARDKAARERSMMQELPVVTGALTSILESEPDPIKQQQSLSRWALNNAALLSTNDAAKTALQAAMGSVNKPLTTYTDEDLLRMGVPFEQLDTNKDGVVSEAERNPMQISGALTGMQRASVLTKQSEALEERRQKLLDDSVGALTRVKFGTLKSDDPTAPAFEDPDKFASAGSEVAVENVISLLGSPADVAAATAGNAKAKFDIAKRLQQEYMKAATGAASKTPQAKSLINS
jgi:hypothetical protein